MSDLKKAEAIIAQLERKRAACLRAGRSLAARSTAFNDASSLLCVAMAVLISSSRWRALAIW